MDKTQHFIASEALRLDAAVARQTGRSRGQAQAAVRDGAVYVDGQRCRIPAHVLQPGQEVRVEPPAPASRRHIDGGRLRVVYRDAQLLVVDKPAGLPTQPPPRGGDALSLRVRGLLAQDHPQPFVGEVHRLDRDASGLVVYGLDRATTADLAAQFRDHRAGRSYLAVVRCWTPPTAQAIDEPIGADSGDRGGIERGVPRQMVRADGAPAQTMVKPLAWDAAAHLALLDVAIATGRTHQIRVHLAWAIGPIRGDGWYGDPDGPLPSAAGGRIALHAQSLRLRHPGDGKVRQWHAEPPPDFWPSGSSLQPPRSPATEG